MNKQELIAAYERINNFSEAVKIKSVIENLKQLDEPQKVVVPQFVANWYEKHKYNFEFSIWDYVYMFDRQEETSFKKWFNEPKSEPFKTLVNMHQFGYEVEKEKRYLVKIKGLNPSYSVLKYHPYDKTWFFGREQEYEFFRLHHTRKELEDAEFGDVFNSPLFEVEEVE